MNFPKSSAEILAAALQKNQKNSRPKKHEPFAGQMSTFPMLRMNYHQRDAGLAPVNLGCFVKCRQCQ
jgi:hypothetical protein